MNKIPERTKEDWQKLARLMGLSEEKIEAVWQEVLEYRRQKAIQNGRTSLWTEEEQPGKR